MPPQVTETEFTCKLITIRTEEAFAEDSGALESLFEPVNLQKLADMTAAGDHGGIQSYFKELSADHEFSIFFQLDQGSTQRLAGPPANSPFSLIGKPAIGKRLFAQPTP